MLAIAIETVNDGILTVSKNPNLTPKKEYHVIELNGGFIRVVNDDLEPVLYPVTLFDIVDIKVPVDWIEVNYDGEISRIPAVFSDQFFFEDYFDGNKNNIQKYNDYILANFGLSKHIGSSS
jgi:hypothetical protein